ncbi:MAG TPA: glycerol-3-phosphate acyltransferase [Reyranella sp.]|nr:glycerol-3-phosphate acyltransferase [Reyranella sp.]
MHGKDIRNHGGKSAGLTNALRVLGKFAASLVLVIGPTSLDALHTGARHLPLGLPVTLPAGADTNRHEGSGPQ